MCGQCQWCSARAGFSGLQKVRIQSFVPCGFFCALWLLVCSALLTWLCVRRPGMASNHQQSLLCLALSCKTNLRGNLGAGRLGPRLAAQRAQQVLNEKTPADRQRITTDIRRTQYPQGTSCICMHMDAGGGAGKFTRA